MHWHWTGFSRRSYSDLSASHAFDVSCSITPTSRLLSQNSHPSHIDVSAHMLGTLEKSVTKLVAEAMNFSFCFSPSLWKYWLLVLPGCWGELLSRNFNRLVMKVSYAFHAKKRLRESCSNCILCSCRNSVQSRNQTQIHQSMYFIS